VRLFDKSAILTLMCVGAIACAGCSTESKPSDPPLKTLSRSLVGVNRVVFIELAERNSYPGIAAEMTTALSHALKARGLFGVDVIERSDPICQELPAVGRAGLTPVQISAMRKTFQCDGILLGALQDFRPHPRMQLGLSLRLLDLKRGRIVWAVDHVWDSADKAVDKRVQAFFEEKLRSGYGHADWRIAMISPKVFEKFIAYELAETLPEPAQASTGPTGTNQRSSAK